MSQAYPETERSEAAEEGEAAHEIAAEMIEALSRAGVGYPGRESSVGSAASNGVVITDEMYDAAEMYAQDVGAVMRERNVFGGTSLGIEQHIQAPRVHELSGGTPDCFLYDKEKGEIFVWDFKFGYGVVEAYQNWQCINYIAGLLDLFEIDGHQDEHIRVHVRIAQPRASHRDGPIRQWSTTAQGLRASINILSNNAHKALSPDVQTRSGPHCQHCPARHACSAALQGGMRLYEVAGQPVPAELSPEALGTQLAIVQRAKKQLEYLASGYEAQALGLIRSGKTVPGYDAVDSFGREKWARPVEEIIVLGEMLGCDLSKPTVVTPKQAEKLGVDESVITAYSETPRSGLKLVADKSNKAKKVFKK